MRNITLQFASSKTRGFSSRASHEQMLRRQAEKSPCLFRVFLLLIPVVFGGLRDPSAYGDNLLPECEKTIARLDATRQASETKCAGDYGKSKKLVSSSRLDSCVTAAREAYSNAVKVLKCPIPILSKPSPIRDWGYPDLLHTFADVNGDGLPDYCRFVGNAPNIFLSCQLRRPGPTVDYGTDYEFNSAAGITLGIPEPPPTLVDVNGDGRADYCRYLGFLKPFRACAFARSRTTPGFGIEDDGRSHPLQDSGYPNLLRTFIDVNGDGILDYCRFVGNAPNIFLSCQLGRPDGSYGFPYGFNSVPGIDPGYPKSAILGRLTGVNGDRRVYFCRKVGSPQATFKACMPAGPEGFSPDQYFPDPTDACALYGAATCDPNAHCQNSDDKGFRCVCNDGFVGDGTRACRTSRTQVTVGACVKHWVEVTDGGVNLYLNQNDSLPWGADEGAGLRGYGVRYIQSDEPKVNYCGPTAGKNFLSWYGYDPSYGSIASDMHIENWDLIPIIGVATATCFGNWICAAALTSTIKSKLGVIGVLPRDFRNTLYRKKPSGYAGCGTQEHGSWQALTAVRNSLISGNPVIVLESGEEGNLHWAVITGLNYKRCSGGLNSDRICDAESDCSGGHCVDGNVPAVRVANSVDGLKEIPWNDFYKEWSINKVGDSTVRDALGDDILQLRPYIDVRWCGSPSCTAGSSRADAKSTP